MRKPLELEGMKKTAVGDNNVHFTEVLEPRRSIRMLWLLRDKGLFRHDHVNHSYGLNAM